MFNLQASPQHQTVSATDDGGSAAVPAMPARSRRPRTGVWRKVRRVVLWLFVAAAAFQFTFNLWTSVLLNRELAAIRGRGEPLSLAEQNARVVPHAQNAALVYRRADAALTPAVKNPHVTRTHGAKPRPMPPGAAEFSEGDLLQNRKAIALVRQAAAMPQCHFVSDWSNPMKVALPHLAIMRRLARLMRAQALHEAERGETEQALVDVRAIFLMSRHLADASTVIEALVSRAVEATGYATLGRVLMFSKVGPAQAHAILLNLPGVDWSQAMPHAMQGERAFGLWCLETIREHPSGTLAMGSGESEIGPGATAPPSLLLRPLWFVAKLVWSPWSKLDEIAYLRYMNAVIVQTTQSPFMGSAGSDSVALASIPRYAIITRILAPVFGQALVFVGQAQTQHRLAEVALALACYHTATGHYPAALRDTEAIWASPLPSDPYRNQPFVYKAEHGSYLLYSVGPNKHDDGGYDQTPKRVDDIVWRNHQRAEHGVGAL